MASRLYPGFGSGKGTFEGHYEVRSFPAAGHKELEAGDKVILPASALKDISRLKLPFPLVFRVANERLKTANTVPTATGKLPPSTVADQYAGVFEFSAPEGTVLVPAWMMANLKLREGGKVCFTSARGLPQASYAKFRPHSQAFVDLAAEIGPRDLLEAAMRNYSVLSAGERIVVDVADTAYMLDVLEVKPERAATLYGNVDLEVDFAPVKGSPDDVAYQAAVAEEKAVLAEVKAAKVAAASAASPASAGSSRTVTSKTSTPSVGGVKGTKAGTPASAVAKAAVGPVVKRAAGGGAAAVRAMAAAASAAGLGVTGTSTTPMTPVKATISSSSPSSGASSVAPPLPVSAAAGAAASVAALSPAARARAIAPARSPGFSPQPVGGVAGQLRAGAAPPAFDFKAPMVADFAAEESHDAFAAAGLRTPPRGGAAVATAPVVEEAAVAPPLVFVGAGNRLGGLKDVPLKSPTAAMRSPAAARAALSPDKAAAAAAAASAEEVRRVRELRAKAALGRLAAPPQPVVEQAAVAAAPAAPATPAAPARPAPAFASPKTVQADAVAVAAAAEVVNEDGTRTCPFCCTCINPAAFDLHVLRCKRNTAYHKAPCASCGALVTAKDTPTHVHCADCTELVPFPDGATVAAAVAAHAAACPQRLIDCECKAKIMACQLTEHRDACPAALETCKFCRVKHKRAGIAAHQDKCGGRTATCEACGKLVVLKLMEAHGAPWGPCEVAMKARAEAAAAKEAAARPPVVDEAPPLPLRGSPRSKVAPEGKSGEGEGKAE